MYLTLILWILHIKGDKKTWESFGGKFYLIYYFVLIKYNWVVSHMRNFDTNGNNFFHKKYSWTECSHDSRGLGRCEPGRPCWGSPRLKRTSSRASHSSSPATVPRRGPVEWWVSASLGTFIDFGNCRVCPSVWLHASLRSRKVCLSFTFRWWMGCVCSCVCVCVWAL